MSNRPKIFLAVVVAISAVFFPYVASYLFEATIVHGFISWDVFFTIIILSIHQKKKIWSIPFVLGAIIFATINANVPNYIFAGLSIAIFFCLRFLPQKNIVTAIAFLSISLISLICDAELFFQKGFSQNISGIWELAVFYWWGPILFVFLPSIAVGLQFLLAKNILLSDGRLQLSHLQALLILAITIGIHCSTCSLQSKQPILSLPIRDCIDLIMYGNKNETTELLRHTKKDFREWTDSLTLQEANKPTLMVLVESWGVNKSSEYTNLLLKPFANTHTFSGVLKRKAAFTHASEMEDFGILENESVKDLPTKFKEKGFQTLYIHGYSGKFYDRENKYQKLGFDKLLFKNYFIENGYNTCHYGFSGICDTSMVDFIDSLMSDPIPKFIHWTTLDAHPPLNSVELTNFAPECKEFNLSEGWCKYLTLQYNSLYKIADIAKKHPEYKIIIRGDHRPMFSAESGFVGSFYYKYVPIVILN